MNLFFVDDDPRVAARELGDKHVSKMLLEACQMMSTAARRHGYDGGYASAYQHHPMTVWVGDSREHYEWCWEHALELAREFEHRFGHGHKSAELLPTLSMAMWTVLPENGWRNPPRCMPNEYKRAYDEHAGPESCHVASYRDYYRVAKAHLHKFTNREAPVWLRV